MIKNNRMIIAEKSKTIDCLVDGTNLWYNLVYGIRKAFIFLDENGMGYINSDGDSGILFFNKHEGITLAYDVKLENRKLLESNIKRAVTAGYLEKEYINEIFVRFEQKVFDICLRKFAETISNQKNIPFYILVPIEKDYSPFLEYFDSKGIQYTLKK